ncbi:MAG: DUF6941 family protein [Planctomycetota bacterium]|jgi:hypothetical protein
MEVETFLLCDWATDQYGKLNVLGAFDTIYSPKMPARHPTCAVAARIRFSKIEEGQHHIKINFIDEDGNSILTPLENTIKVELREEDSSVIRNIILYLQGFKLSGYGEYRIDLAIDGKQEASIPFKVKRMPQKQ